MRRFSPFLVIVMTLGAACISLNGAELGDVEIHGALSQGYIHSEGNNFVSGSEDCTSDFWEYGLNASIPIGERGRFGGQVFGRKFGSTGSDVYLDWLVAEYSWRDWLRFRAGKLKVPYGLYGATRDIDSLRTEILLPQGVYIEYIRGSYNSAWSGSLSGYILTESMGGFDYSIQCGVRAMDEDSGEMERLVGSLGLTVDDIEEDTALAASVIWYTPVQGLRVGGTWSWSEFSMTGMADSQFGPIPYSAATEDQLMLVGSIEYANGPLTVVAENMYGSFESPFDYASPFAPSIQYDSIYTGYYLKGDYRCSEWLAVGGAYSHFWSERTIDTSGVPGQFSDSSDSDDWSVFARFDLTKNLILKIEQHFVFGSAGVFEHENPDGVEDDWSMTLAKVSYVF